MANPHRGEVAFEANGERYVLRYSIDAICALEGSTGKGIVALVGELMNPTTMSITLARKVLWAGLQEHHPDITEKQAGELIVAAGGLGKIVKLFNDSFERAFPEAKAKNPRKAGGRSTNGTGPLSGEAGQASAGTKTPSGAEPRASST